MRARPCRPAAAGVACTPRRLARGRPRPERRARGTNGDAVTAGADVVLIVAVIAAIADWWAVARTNRRVEYIAKPATLAALVVMALLLHPAHHGERVFF